MKAVLIMVALVTTLPAYAADTQSPDMTLPVMAGVFILFLIMAVSGGKKKPVKKKKATKRKATKKLTAKQKKQLLKELMQ